MNKDDGENFASPKIGSVKRLGMKRSSNMLTNKANSMTPIASESDRPIRSHGTPQSDAKVNYKTVSPLTPHEASAEHRDTNRRTASANCPPISRQLNKKLGAKMTKKMLQFHSANEDRNKEHKSDDGEGNKGGQVDSPGIEDDFASECAEDLSTSSLISRIADMEKELEARQRHAERISKLKQDIEVWRIGFSTALNDFRKQLQPQMDVETTLKNLNIDPQMSKYVDD